MTQIQGVIMGIWQSAKTGGKWGAGLYGAGYGIVATAGLISGGLLSAPLTLPLVLGASAFVAGAALIGAICGAVDGSIVGAIVGGVKKLFGWDKPSSEPEMATPSVAQAKEQTHTPSLNLTPTPGLPMAARPGMPLPPR